jgi:hypothetical protein
VGGVWKLCGRCVEVVQVCISCVGGVWKLCRRCAEVVQKLQVCGSLCRSSVEVV